MIALVLLLPALAGQPATPPPASVEGAWTLATNVHDNTGTATCDFKQEGAKLTGTCTGPDEKKSDVTGEVAEKKVTFSYGIDWQGSPLTLVFTGNLDSDSEMKGSLDVQPVGATGDFTAKKGCGCD